MLPNKEASRNHQDDKKILPKVNQPDFKLISGSRITEIEDFEAKILT